MNHLSQILTDGQFSAVYNMLSLGLAAMLATTVFMLASQKRVLPRYRGALVASAMVTFIAAYHYFRIFESFKHAFETAPNNPWAYNVGYRYVDWLLTVPLLLVETVLVLALPKAERSSLLNRLVPASAAMIILGYPGDAGIKLFGLSAPIWGALSTIPFLYILYVLFVELTKSLSKQSEQVRGTVSRLRLLLIGTWGVYPISFILNMNADPNAPNWDTFVAREIGYTIADILAKCAFGLTIYKIARMKSFEDDAEFAKTESKDA
ncbi:MAG: xanthorhodopsin [Actinobacteria bacterium]|nr:xanthorhodopsin [Actinomycetota bacterium]